MLALDGRPFEELTEQEGYENIRQVFPLNVRFIVKHPTRGKVMIGRYIENGEEVVKVESLH